ncbi:MAG TPA: gliding motility-associated C-terminal domain-containing protein, partial [Flavobacteriia bacterium]|nr:gliding motility-associated C-terminal domain-containing protein [Flavobacteriia bacterium]
DVCATATVTITITDQDTDGDGVSDGQETIDGTDVNDGCSYNTASQVIANVTAAWNALDCDGDGVINGTEITDGTDPKDMCSLVIASQSVAPSAAWNAADCDNDGNANGSDPNPLVPSATDDAFTAPNGGPTTFNILSNDDFLPGANTSITQTGGTAGGTISFDPLTGEVTYTPLSSELDTDVTIEYQVCNTVPDPDVCETATITISVIDPDTDGDGVRDSDEVADGTDPNDPCDFVPASRTLEPSDEWNAMDCDNDNVSNEDEWNPSGDGNGPDDTDGDGIFDFLDVDDDGDGIATIEEDADSDGNPMNDDCDSDGTPDYLDSEACMVEIPTLFTPDGDGINDVFEIPGLANLFPNFEMKIYNRWGNVVYDYKNDGRSQPDWWDGFSDGRITINSSKVAPTGTYFYVINFNDNNRKPESGWIYLNR